MKKLFISCPMKDRTEENIKDSMERMHQMAELIFCEKLDVIPSYIEENPPEDVNRKLWYLGKSIQLLAEADYFIGIGYSECFVGCDIEAQAARKYGIRATFVDMAEFMPDAVEIEKRYFLTMAPVGY